MNNAVKNYQTAQVNTVGNGEVIILLYEGAIRFLTQAKVKIAEKDYATKGMLISRAMDIVHELDNSLNMEKGGEIAQNLHGLYVFASTTLLRANIKLDCEMIDSVIHILSELKWSFENIVNTPEAKAAEEEIRQSRSSNYVARAVTTSETSSVGQNAANSAYANVAKSAGVEVGHTQTARVENANTASGQKNEVSADMIGSFLTQQASAIESKNVLQGQIAQQAVQQAPQVANTQTVTQSANPLTLNQNIGVSIPKQVVEKETALNTNIQQSQQSQQNQESQAKANPFGAVEETKALKNPLLARLNKV